jgi:hypothetical protein
MRRLMRRYHDEAVADLIRKLGAKGDRSLPRFRSQAAGIRLPVLGVPPGLRPFLLPRFWQLSSR